MANEETLYSVHDRIATITLHRPDKLNAWTATMEKEVRAAMDQAEQDDHVRVIVLTGAGRGFCAGADMSLLQDVVEHGVHPLPDSASDHATANGDDVRADFKRQYSYFPAIPKPVIAAIN